MQQLLIATHNAHKTAEFRQMLGDRFEVLDLSIFPGVAPVEETGASFEENATIKALHAAKLFDGLVLADDSGLEVDALGGAPGVSSARYAGPEATDAANRAKLLRELANHADSRWARFRCVLVLADRAGVVATVAGALEGNILSTEKGQRGFGYDALFRPEGFDGSLGEMTLDEKNKLSHRAVALRDLMGDPCFRRTISH